ncbi:RNA-directed DNA polymerase from mobile element jockey [Plakobranchus ocellatus]|uniref:RNA-directed DNA polymerase from mobile element jockey n=1 Tax=Plakobranchus ocellatus TaxID=259542 RepID=A0AAV4D6C7_9GAST|nr:RNA-directed DNA polymerase from mobile element jockey [Plakobranchus ocellatus]
MSVSPFAGWSPLKKFLMISSKGSAKVADRSPFKIHRELKSILGDGTIEVTKLGSGDLMVELKSNDQAKKLGAMATFLDIPVTVSPHKSLNSSKGVIRSRDLWCCSEEEMVEELSGVTHARRIKNKPFFATKLRFSKLVRQLLLKSIKRFQCERLLVLSNLSFE